MTDRKLKNEEPFFFEALVGVMKDSVKVAALLLADGLGDLGDLIGEVRSDDGAMVPGTVPTTHLSHRVLGPTFFTHIPIPLPLPVSSCLGSSDTTSSYLFLEIHARTDGSTEVIALTSPNVSPLSVTSTTISYLM